jgi:glutaredoxin
MVQHFHHNTTMNFFFITNIIIIILGSSSYCPLPMKMMTMTTAFSTIDFSSKKNINAKSRALHYNGQSTTTRRRLYMSVPNSFDVFTSGLASIFRLPNGVTVSNNVISNNKIRLVKLYDVENSKTCRPVREKITEFDLVVEQVIPSATNSIASILPNNCERIPVLVAAVSEEEFLTIEGTENILKFLDESFVDQEQQQILDANNSNDQLDTFKEYLQLAGMYLTEWIRLGKGSQVSSSVTSSPNTVNRPEKTLILYSYEGNQFCRIVREVLTELDITYELRSAGKESPRRDELASITGGSTQCPYLIDPNTGVSIPDSKDIVEYLYRNYALWTPPNEILEWTSTNVMSLFKPIFSTIAPLQAGEKDADNDFQQNVEEAIRVIKTEVDTDPVVVYTYELSPFSSETKDLLDRLDVDYKEISLGKEWIPGLISENGPIKRAALLKMTGQSSLPHIFIGGKPIGGLFSGSPGLVPMLKNGDFFTSLSQAMGRNSQPDLIDTVE